MEMRQLSFEHSVVTLAFQKHNHWTSSSAWSCPWWNTPLSFSLSGIVLVSAWKHTCLQCAHDNCRFLCSPQLESHRNLRLESASGDCLVQPTAQSSVSQSRLPTTAGGPVRVWIFPRMEASPPLWETCSTVWSPLETKCFLVFKWIFLYFSLYLLLLVHSLNATKKRLVPFSFEQALKPPSISVTLHWTCSSLTKPVLL